MTSPTINHRLKFHLDGKNQCSPKEIIRTVNLMLADGFERQSSISRFGCGEFVCHTLSEVSREIPSRMLAPSQSWIDEIRKNDFFERILHRAFPSGYQSRTGSSRRQHGCPYYAGCLWSLHDHSCSRSHQTTRSKCSVRTGQRSLWVHSQSTVDRFRHRKCCKMTMSAISSRSVRLSAIEIGSSGEDNDWSVPMDRLSK